VTRPEASAQAVRFMILDAIDIAVPRGSPGMPA
jgi:hypothetical protein